jgi:hypothetical protein
VLVKSGRRPDAGGRKLQRGYFMETAAIPGPQPAEFPAVSGQPHSTAIEKRKAMSPYRFMLVAKQPFFKGLNAQQLQLLTDMAIEIKFQPGEVIFQEGSPANRFYVILEGKVVLESKLKPPGMVAIQTLGPGDELGWSWLFRSSNLLLTARFSSTEPNCGNSANKIMSWAISSCIASRKWPLNSSAPWSSV